MVRKGWFLFVGSFALGMVLGCSSNPYRPTLFHKNRDQVVSGPELGAPVMEGPYMGGGNPQGFPTAPNGTIVMPPNYAPPPQPIQGFPPNTPPQTGPSPTVPQGPPPRVSPGNPTGRTG